MKLPRRAAAAVIAGAAALMLLVPALSGATAGTSPARAASSDWIPISGSGSTWSQNAIEQWRRNVGNLYSMTVNFTGNGSSAGRQDFINQTVDFAISEIPFQAQPEDGSPPEIPQTGYAYMPIVAGGTSLMYNLKIGGKRVTNLRLSGQVIAKIFTGKITNWNDAAIKADNPGLTMPDLKITPVVRSDGSGTSAQFTAWMSKQYPSIWTRGMTSQFPVLTSAFKAQNGSLGVAGYVGQDYANGAITYVEYSYALKAKFPVAKVLNNAGYYIEPTYQSVAVALMGAQINTTPGANYLTQILDNVYNNADPRTYPMSSYSYMIVPTAVNKVFTAAKGRTLGAFATYMLCEGQQSAAQLGYSPLPMNLVMAGSDQIKRIPGASTSGVDFNACNNPTFKKGDSPSKNQLAASAPQPQACDKQGPTQCATGTGGATQPTTTKNSGASTGGTSGGSSSGGSGTGGTTAGGTANAGGTGTGGATTSDGSTPQYDANGNLVNAANAGGAASTPFKLPQDPWGPPQITMTVAAGLLLAAIVLPPLLLRRLRRGPSGD